MKKQGLNTLNDFIVQSAETYADRKALVVNDYFLTYNQLNTRSNSLAALLQKRGIKYGGHVGILSENTPFWGAAFFGIIKTGASAVCLDVLNSEEELLYVLNHSETRICFSSKTQLHKLQSLKEKVPTLREILEIETHEEIDNNGYKPVEIDASSTAILIYTSGTMGNQKGVMLSHSNIISNIIGGFDHISFKPGTNFTSLIPLSHMFGINAGFLAPIFKGATVTYSPSLKGSEISKTLIQSRTEILVLVPLILKKFYSSIVNTIDQYSPFRKLAFRLLFSLSDYLNNLGIQAGNVLFGKIHKKLGGHLSFFISGGAPLEKEIEDFFNTVGIPILNGYGLTETSPIVSVNSVHYRKAGSTGRIIPEVDIKFGKEGEIFIRGPSVMKGYFKDIDSTGKVMQNGWFKSGDIGELDKDGFLFIKDRLKNVIVLPSGLKIFPNEIEQEIGRSPLFIESCIVKRATSNGEEAVAIIFPNSQLLIGLSPGEQQLKIRQELEFYQKNLPAFKKVLNFKIWPEELPKTSTKKVKRKVLEQLINSSPVEENGTARFEAALNKEEEHLASLVRKFLNKSDAHIDLKTNLSNDLGIDSIMKIELIAEIENDLNISIPEEIIYTIESFDDLVGIIWTHSNNYEFLNKQDAHEESLKESGKITKATSAFLFYGMLKFLFRIDVINRNNIPQSGSFIIAANHSSMLDFPVLSAILPKKMRKEIFVPAAHDYFFKKSFVTRFFRAGFNIIPMKRYGNYYDGLKLCSQKIKEGKSLIVFPEGTRSVSGELQQFKPGIGLLAVDSDVPLIPVYINGAYRALPKGATIPKPGKIQVIIGDPISAINYKNSMRNEANYIVYQKITDEVKNTIEQLKAKT